MVFFSFEDCVTSSFIPIKPFNDIKEHQPTVEVEEFVQESTKYSRPYRVYKNQIYIYPKHLKYDSQKHFNKVQYVMINSGQYWVGMYYVSSVIGRMEYLSERRGKWWYRSLIFFDLCSHEALLQIYWNKFVD